MTERYRPSLPEAWSNFKRELRHRRGIRLVRRLGSLLDDSLADERLLVELAEWVRAPKKITSFRRFRGDEGESHAFDWLLAARRRYWAIPLHQSQPAKSGAAPLIPTRIRTSSARGSLIGAVFREA